MVYAKGFAALFDGDIARAQFHVAPLGLVVLPDRGAEDAGVQGRRFRGIGFGDFDVIESGEMQWGVGGCRADRNGARAEDSDGFAAVDWTHLSDSIYQTRLKPR